MSTKTFDEQETLQEEKLTPRILAKIRRDQKIKTRGGSLQEVSGIPVLTSKPNPSRDIPSATIKRHSVRDAEYRLKMLVERGAKNRSIKRAQQALDLAIQNEKDRKARLTSAKEV